MLKIGLTGGIASGKSRISHVFSQLQIPIIDTDVISREMLEPDQPGYMEIKHHFGNDILLSDAQIDRSKLRQLIFNDSTEKCWLESILHPLIFEQSLHQIEQHSQASYIIVVIPVLFETNFSTLVNRILVVDCDADMQIERLRLRDKINLTLAKKMLAQQWSNQSRLALADDIIHNGDNGDLNSQIMVLHQKYLSLS